MDTKLFQKFVSEKHNAVLSTFRASGSIQMSIVTVGPMLGGAAFTTTVGRAKLSNLRRNPQCSLLISGDAWSPYVVLEGSAKLYEESTTEPNKLRLILRDIYRNASGKEHPDWPEYDKAMVKDGRAAVVIITEELYGTLSTPCSNQRFSLTTPSGENPSIPLKDSKAPADN